MLTEVINIRFRNTGKVYFFAPNGLTVQPGDFVIVETSKGLEYGECTAGNHEVNDSAIVPPLRPAIRLATAEDKKTVAINREKEARAFNICLEKIEAHKLDMKLVDVEYSFEGNKILFFFTSDGRVDFRELVKDLVSVFRARIELRQIGVRDGAKMLGGLGICGRAFCCSSFLDDFHPVSIKMAKTQSLSLNPTKISGTCGRLMCCLKYEQGAYEDLIKNAPKVSASIVTPYGQGTVTEVNLLRQNVKVRVDEGDTAGIHVVPFCDIGKTVSCAPKPEPMPATPSTFIRSEHPKPATPPKPEQKKNAPADAKQEPKKGEGRGDRPKGDRQERGGKPAGGQEQKKGQPEGRGDRPKNGGDRQERQRNVFSGKPEARRNAQNGAPKQEQNGAQQNSKAPRPISELQTQAAQNVAESAEKPARNRPFKRFIKKKEPGEKANTQATPDQGAQNPTEGAGKKQGGRNRRRHKPKPPEAPKGPSEA